MLFENERGRRAQFPLYLTAGLLIALGCVHVPIFLASGEPWEGPVSWRKPILFGVSTGMTVWSIGYVMPRLQYCIGDRIVAWTFSIALVIEVALIALQTWRGVASHFNHTTVFDSAVAQSMLLMITWATVVIFYIAVRSMLHLKEKPDVRLAINAGFVFLILSCIIGFVISSYGNQQAAIGENPSRYGDAGVTKFPHGVAIHAIQIFPLISWALVLMRVEVVWRKRMIWVAIWLMAIMLVFSIAQTLAGRARFELPTRAAILHPASPISLTADQRLPVFYRDANG